MSRNITEGEFKMSTYDFECTVCDKTYSITCDMRNYQTKKITVCECGSVVTRSYSNANIETLGTDGKRNMTSPNFWKNGKTNTQIASVLSDETEPY